MERQNSYRRGQGQNSRLKNRHGNKQKDKKVPIIKTNTKREEAIVHNYRKMMRKKGIGRDAGEPQTKFNSQKSNEHIDGDINTTWSSRLKSTTSKSSLEKKQLPSSSITTQPHGKNMSSEEEKEKEEKCMECIDVLQNPEQKFEKKKLKKNKLSSFQRAKNEMEIKKEDERRKIFKLKIFDEQRAIAFEKRKKKKFYYNKFINQKNSKGQPLFKGQIQMILDKLQNQKTT